MYKKSWMYVSYISLTPASFGKTRTQFPTQWSVPSGFLWASIINSATKYHIPSLRSFHPPFKRIFTVIRRPCVETCKYLRRSSRVAHRPFRLTMCTSRSLSYILPSLAAEKTAGLSSLSRRIHVRERRYALLRRPALREAFENISSPAWGTTVPLSFLPRCSLLEVMWSRCDKGSSWVSSFYTTDRNDMGPYRAM